MVYITMILAVSGVGGFQSEHVRRNTLGFWHAHQILNRAAKILAR